MALNNKKLIYLLQNERKLNLILDNARIHTAKFVEEMCDILSINLVFLPLYCPFLNPIGDVLEDIKREIYISDYETLDDLIGLFTSLFYEIVDNVTYYENWLIEFFGINLW
ncbi:MAG: transposase [Methanosphaera sp.]|nr:transposase [Methanosphaera sp.]